MSADITATHIALIYRRPEELLSTVIPFVREGLADGERAMVLTELGKLELLRRELGQLARAVEFTDLGTTSQRQARIIHAVIDFARRNDGRRIRIVAEQSLARRSQREIDDYLRIEAAWNVAFHSLPVSVLCPYDASALPADVVLACQRTHPALAAEHRLEPSDEFVDPRGYIAGSCVVIEPPASAAVFSAATTADLAPARAFVRSQAARAGLGAEATDELTIAVSEVLTNALDHGKPPRFLYAYREGPMLVCQVHDSGDSPWHPLASYLPPGDGAAQGRGLWVARQLCDSLEIATDATGTHVRLFALLDPRPATHS